MAPDLLMCSGVVVADRKATKGTGGWEMARVEQGGDSEGRDSSVPAQCPYPCPELCSSRPPDVLYQLHFPFRPGCSAPQESPSEDLLDA